MEESNIWFLENIDAQGIFCPKKIELDLESHTHISYKKGEFIFRQNEPAEKLYFITSGRVKIGTEGDSDKTVTKAILVPGEIFGELVLVGQHQRRDYAQAIESTDVCVISRQVMNSLLRDHNPLYVFMMNLIGSRAIQMEKRLESLVFKDSRSRIVEYLIELTNTRGHRVGFEWVVRKFITHQEIANLTATSRQTVTTVLNDLKNKKLITFDRRRLLIRDLNRMKHEISLFS